MTEAPPPALPDRLLHYLNGGFSQVRGWCSRHLWQIIEPITVIQRSEGLDAPVCEIGVHHGKFFIGLANMVETRKKSLAIDLFDMQELNVDSSGKGSKRRFLDNVAKYADPDLVEALTADSLSLDASRIGEIERAHGKFAYFSIDGSHTAKHTANDIRVAMQLTAPGGLIFIDDYFNPYWPGVQEAVAAVYAGGPRPFVPLCYAHAKLILTDTAHHELYLNAIMEHLKPHRADWRVGLIDRFGWKTVAVFSPVKTLTVAESETPAPAVGAPSLPLPLGGMPKGLREYLTKGLPSIRGTVPADLWAVIHPIEAIRRRQESRAAVCGVGVQQGRLFIGLLNTVDTDRQSLAIDRFQTGEAQGENHEEGSSSNRPRTFLENLARYADPARVTTWDADTSSLGASEFAKIERTHGKFAYFSIEESCTAERTVHDLTMAARLTDSGGLILLADYYNGYRQGVHEGVARFFSSTDPGFVPLCSYSGRLILTDCAHHAAYCSVLERQIARRYPTLRFKACERFGWKSLTIGPEWRKHITD